MDWVVYHLKLTCACMQELPDSLENLRRRGI